MFATIQKLTAKIEDAKGKFLSSSLTHQEKLELLRGHLLYSDEPFLPI
jgi:hypothetical protein